MMKLNKKAMMEFIPKIAAVLLALVFIGIILYAKLTNNVSVLDAYQTSNDYDGDGTNDVMDDCPCGDQQKWYDASSGTYWCVAGYDQRGCTCANDYAIYVRSKSKSKDTKDLFAWKIDSDSTGNNNDKVARCVYKKEEGCAYLIYADDKNIKQGTMQEYCKQIFS